MPLSKRDTKQQLITKLKMEPRNRKSDDHDRYVLMIDGQIVVRTHFSRGAKPKTLPDGLVATMARQLGVNSVFFKEIVSCTKSRDDYLAELSAKGILRPDRN